MRKTEYLTRERPIQYEPNTSAVYYKSNDQRQRIDCQTCSSVINFSATLGSWLGVALEPWWLAWLVAAGHEGWRAPQNAAAGFPPVIESIMFEPCTCIIVHFYSPTPLLAFTKSYSDLFEAGPTPLLLTFPTIQGVN